LSKSMILPDLVVVGPTAAGKTDLAVELAIRMDGEVVSADALQIYRQMHIGTAKPDAGQMRGVPHHMIGCVDVDEPYSVGRFQQDARACMEQIHARGRTALLCGGTGLYVHALLHELDFGSGEADLDFRRELQAFAAREGNQALHDRLAQASPEAAARLHPNDTMRVIRALELHRQGKPIGSYGQRVLEPAPAPVVGLTMERRALYARIEARVDRMMRDGLLQEVQGLLAAGYDPSLTSLQALGYKELIAHLQGACTLAQAVEKIKQRTRNFAKRQLTWFRREKGIVWIERTADQRPAELADLAEQALRQRGEDLPTEKG
jgi:tRNA dimethylallyltransferase